MCGRRRKKSTGESSGAAAKANLSRIIKRGDRGASSICRSIIPRSWDLSGANNGAAALSRKMCLGLRSGASTVDDPKNEPFSVLKMNARRRLTALCANPTFYFIPQQSGA